MSQVYPVNKYMSTDGLAGITVGRSRTLSHGFPSASLVV